MGALVTGMMGVHVQSTDTSTIDLATNSHFAVTTLARLSNRTPWAQMTGVRVRGNLLDIRHSGAFSTTIRNSSGPAITWRPTFHEQMSTLNVNGHPVATTILHGSADGPLSYVDVLLHSGATVTVFR